MAELFSDGFECPPNTAPDTFTAWTGKNGTPTIVGAPVHHGSYSAEFNAIEYCHKTLDPSQPIIYHRYYVRFDVLPADDEVIELSRGVAGGTAIFAVGVNHYGANAVWQFNYRNGAAWTTVGTATQPVVDTWYCVEIYWKKDDVAGEVILYVNDVNIGSVSDKDTADYGNCDSIRNGVSSENLDGAFVVNEDCVVVADAYIGCEAVGVPIAVMMHHYNRINKIIRG